MSRKITPKGIENLSSFLSTQSNGGLKLWFAILYDVKFVDQRDAAQYWISPGGRMPAIQKNLLNLKVFRIKNLWRLCMYRALSTKTFSNWRLMVSVHQSPDICNHKAWNIVLFFNLRAGKEHGEFSLRSYCDCLYVPFCGILQKSNFSLNGMFFYTCFKWKISFIKMVDAFLQVLGWFVSQPGNMDKLKRRWWAMAI